MKITKLQMDYLLYCKTQNYSEYDDLCRQYAYYWGRTTQEIKIYVEGTYDYESNILER